MIGVTLLLWRSKGTGPAYVKLPDSRLVRYRKEDVDAWLEGQKK